MARVLSTVDTILSEDEWRARRARHEARVRPWVEHRQARRKRGEKHPIDDFLFEYYPYSVGKLLTWHPGHGTALAGDAADYLQYPQYKQASEGITTGLAWLTGSSDRITRLDLAIRLLEGMSTRPASTGCFGLHEWAMVYGLEQVEIRHSNLALRLTPTQIADTVREVGLRCTHIDAYRFFTPAAVPLNANQPTRASQPELDQPGCLHANMDLYKYAMWFSPYVGSDLVADCFALARMARELDMRASPYDVASYDLAPIHVEMPSGRAEYARNQLAIMDAAVPLRNSVRSALLRLRTSISA